MDLKRLLGALDVLGCVALYMVVGPALILVNKQLMTSYGFPYPCLLYTSPSPRDGLRSRMPSSA